MFFSTLTLIIYRQSIFTPQTSANQFFCYAISALITKLCIDIQEATRVFRTAPSGSSSSVAASATHGRYTPSERHVARRARTPERSASSSLARSSFLSVTTQLCCWLYIQLKNLDSPL